MLSKIVNRLPILLIIFFFRMGDIGASVDSFPEITSDQLNPWTPMIGGCGGVFFQAVKGNLKIEFEKEDLSPSGITNVRLVVFTPDREVIFDQWTSESAPLNTESVDRRRFSISTKVDHEGVYGMMITAAYDRYGEKFKWRFRTNCDKYMIETSRGHKDVVHEEPVVLKDSHKDGEICFLPPDNDFEISVRDLADEVKTIELRDVHDRLIRVFKTEKNGIKEHIRQGKREGIPWKLYFQKAEGMVDISGVTTWDDRNESEYFSGFPNGTLWTPDAGSWFDFHENRWLISPSQQTVFANSSEEKSIGFIIHNNGTKEKRVELELEFPDGAWEAQLSEEEVVLGPDEEKVVSVFWKAGSENQKLHLRATHGDVTTYSTLNVKMRGKNSSSNIDLPLVLTPYNHENKQLGYSPEYPLDNQVYFNKDHEPFIRTAAGVSTRTNNKWTTTATIPSATSKIAFDEDGDIYTIGREDGRAFLLHSRDAGKTYTAYEIPGNSSGSSFDIEQFSGHNIPKGSPPIIRFTRSKTDEKHFWRRYGEMELLLPVKEKGEIKWEKPLLISDQSLGFSSHSGIPSSMVSAGNKIFICWGEATDPEVSLEEIPGVPAYVAVYDRETGKLDEPVIAGYGAPPNDVHNTPSITLDGEGYLHVLTGTHGQPFQYARSAKPYSTGGGWTEAVPVMESEDSRSTQTYIGLVTGTDNTLHLVFRLWQYDTEYFPDNYFAALAYMSKKPGEPWSEPQPLVIAPFSHYSVYYHRLTIDRKGRLFLSYDYWSTYWFYRNDRKNERSLLMSEDDGKHWKLVTEEDF